MKIAFDISPLKSGHAVRGIGTYTAQLKKALMKYYPENEYFFLENHSLMSTVDIVHYPYFEPFSLTLPLKKRAKTVITIHDLIPLIFPKHFPSGIKGAVKWRIQKQLVKGVDAIITDSEASKKDIVNLTGVSSEKVHVIYLAAGEEFKAIIISENEKREFLKKYNLPEKFILYVGDATWNKNLPTLITACKKINIPLVLVGKAISNKNIDRSSPWNSSLVEVQEKIDNKHIISLGFIPEVDLIKIYNLALALVMPSLYEGFGLPVLEAMACGCPVVTSKKGSIPEVAGEAGLYIDPNSAASISQGVEQLLSDSKLRKEVISKGFLQGKKFSWEKTAKETVRIYKKLLITKE